MTAEEWKAHIQRACLDAGTYKPFFGTVIEQLAQVLEVRDIAREQFRTSGNSPVIKYTNKGGYTNLKKNPALVVMNECDQQALAYWRDLGLTPKGYKNLTGEAVDEKKGGTLEAMLKKLEI